MADLLKGRANDEVYSTFMKRFVQHSVGKRAWKAWLQEGSKGCPVTPTDEAFVLVVLENAWDVWINLFEQFGGVFRRQKRALSPEKRIRSNKKFKYTSVIMSDQESEEGEDPTSTSRYSRNMWTDQGLARFNKVYQEVKQDREDHKDWDKEWYEENKKVVKKNKKQAGKISVAPVNDM